MTVSVNPSADWQRGLPSGRSYARLTRAELQRSFKRGFPLLDRVLGALPEGTCVAGGVFADLLTGREPNDIDIFFSDLSKVGEVQTLLRRFEDFEAVAFQPTCSLLRSRSSKITLNLLHAVPLTAEETIDKFDFSVVQVAMQPGGQVWLNPDALDDTGRKQFNVSRVQFSMYSRYCKYRNKGMFATKEAFEIIRTAAPHPLTALYRQMRQEREEAGTP